MSDHLLALVLVYCVIRELIYIYTVNKLVNKAMSNSFYDYKQAMNVGKVADPPPLVQEQEYQQDFGHLDEILS